MKTYVSGFITHSLPTYGDELNIEDKRSELRLTCATVNLDFTDCMNVLFSDDIYSLYNKQMECII